MLIFHNSGASNNFDSINNYKRTYKRKPKIIHTKAIEQERQKKLSKKNVKFLEGLGLKVKH